MGSRQSELSMDENARVVEEPQGEPFVLPPGEQFLTKGFLFRHRRAVVAFCVLILTAASLLSYFIKPHSHLGELVTPEQELPGFAAVYPGGDDGLAKRVTNSYSLAFVLIQSPYTSTNLRALENIRSWAQNRFEGSPNFLHPVSVKDEQEPNDTLIGALGYNLFANIKYYLESQVGSFLRTRIADYHNDPAYESFTDSYFEIYGRDAEAATLLARYQSDKAKGSISVVLWTITWAISLAFAILYVTFCSRKDRFERIRHTLILIWGLVAIGYCFTAWMTNSITALISAILAGCSTFYFFRPFVLLTRQDSSLKVYFIQLSSRWVALCVWATYSLLAIAVLTWIRSASAEGGDPVTLLLSALSGNFISDPEEGKHVIARIIGAIWALFSVWAFLQKDKDARISDELEDELKSL